MTYSKTSTIGGIFLLFAFIFFIILAYWDFFHTPQAQILPFIMSLFFHLFVFFLLFGEYFGLAIPLFSKKKFITRGGLIGLYEGRKEEQGGIITCFATIRSTYARHCNWDGFIEAGPFRRFLLMLTPSTMVSVTAKSEMFEEIQTSMCDVPEGVIFYHGTLRKAKLLTIEQYLVMKLENAEKLISQLWTSVEVARSGLEAASQGNDQQLQKSAVTLSRAMEDLNRYTAQNQGIVMVNPNEQQGRR